MAKVKFGTESKKTAVNLSKEKPPVYIEKEKIVNHFVEKRVEVPVIQYVDREVEKIVQQHTIEYKTVEIPVEKIVEIIKVVEKEVPIEKIVYVDKEIEKPIYIDKYIENRELMKKLSDTQKSLTKFKYISGLLVLLIMAGLIYGK